MDEDEYLVELIGRAAGEPPSAGDALARLRPRIRRAHRRRAALRSGAGLAALVVVGSLVSSTTTHSSRDVRVGGPGTTAAVETISVSVAPSTTLPQTPGPGATEAPGAAPASVEVGAGGSAAGDGQEASGATVTVSAAPDVKHPASAAHSSVTSTSAPATLAPPASAAPPPQVTSFGVPAGSVEVQYTETSMSLSEISTSPGWLISETKADAASIQVTFTQQSGDGDPVAVEVHLDDGKPVADDAASGLAGS